MSVLHAEREIPVQQLNVDMYPVMIKVHKIYLVSLIPNASSLVADLRVLIACVKNAESNFGSGLRLVFGKVFYSTYDIQHQSTEVESRYALCIHTYIHHVDLNDS